MNEALSKIAARVAVVNDRMSWIERTAPESGRGPLWQEYDRLSREWDDLDSARNALIRLSR